MPTVVNKPYRDVDLNFIPHPVSGDITTLKDAEAVKRAVRNLLLTGYFERVFQPNTGANLKQLLFDPITPLSQKNIEVAIRDALRNFEHRVDVISVDVNVAPDENGYDVTLTFAIDTISSVVTVDFFLERVR